MSQSRGVKLTVVAKEADGVAGAVWVSVWAGGRVRLARGQRTWVIERRVSGVRRVVTLDVHSEKDALTELALFESDPLNYRTRKQRREMTAAASARLDPATAKEFMDAQQERVARGELSDAYVRHTLAPYLKAWGQVLGNKELRTVSLGDLRTALRGWTTALHKRVVALKAFTAWLRREDRLKRHEDPTLDLEMPETGSARTAPGERAYPPPTIERVYALLRDFKHAVGAKRGHFPEGAPVRQVSRQAERDVFVLRALTGMHASEIDRLARGDGKVEKLTGHGDIAGRLAFLHKSGSWHSISVNAQAFAAAQRLQRAGRAPGRKAMRDAIKFATAGHERLADFTMERLRHSFITLATTHGREVLPKAGRGVPLDRVGRVVGHRPGSRMTSSRYADLVIEPLLLVPLKLVNANDPKLLKRGK